MRKKLSHSINVPHDPRDPSIVFDLNNKTIFIYYDFSSNYEHVSSVPYGALGFGDSLISFLELDFDTYNKILNQYAKEHENATFRAPFSNYFNDYHNLLIEYNICHPYFTAQAFFSLSEVMTPKEFSDYMSIDLKKITFLKHFLYFLSGNPCANLGGSRYIPSPVDPNDPCEKFPEVKEHLATSTYMSAIQYELFRNTPLMHQNLYCELHIDEDTKIIQSYSSGCKYISQHPLSFCIMELSKVLESGIIIRQCKNCNCFFIPQNNHITDYCNRPYKKTGKTCKEVGANRIYKEKVYKNPILQEYERAYKRNYAKCKRNAIDSETFRQWIDEATIERDRVATEYEKSNDIAILDAFKKYLGNK